MKKLTLILALCLLLSVLTACGAQQTAAPAATEAPAPTAEPTPAPTPAPTAAPEAKAEPTPEPTPEPTEEPEPVNEAFEAAKALIGKTTVELFAAIGAPPESDYAPSCLGPGEDGNLYYEGFTVYTYRENGVEQIRIVE